MAGEIRMGILERIKRIFIGYTLSSLVAGFCFMAALALLPDSNWIPIWKFVLASLVYSAAILVFAAPVAIPGIVLLLLMHRKNFVEFATLGAICPHLTLFWLASPKIEFSTESIGYLVAAAIIGALSAYPSWWLTTKAGRY